MTLNEYQQKALETDAPCKGSHFYYEHFDFTSEDDKLPVFVEMLKSRGC